MITVENDFETVENDGIYMTNHGRRTFIREFETKMNQRLKIKGETKTYERLMREEVRKVEKLFRGGETYKPYKYVN